jgi:cytochrome c oxidase cbb3-type subunit 2
MRTGPDLRNVGTRFAGQGGREWHIKHFYDPTITSAGSIMAPYRFLFETKAIIGDASPKAVQSLLPENHQPVAGSEIVLKQRGEDLIAYMLSLKDPELYPEEATKVYVPKAEPAKTEHGAHGAESNKEAAK